MKKEDTERILRDVPQEYCFWVSNGSVLKNLDELSLELSRMSPETYAYHANREKNDFSKWIREIINDKNLAQGLLRCKTKEAALKKVSKRLSELRKKLK